MKINNYLKEGITFIEVTNDVGFTMILSTLGASIYQIKDGDKYLTRNALTVEDFKREECYYGKTIGRVANRIKGHSIKIGEKIYHLSNNEGPNTLHGGHDGLSTKIFDHKVDVDWDKIVVTFSYLSKALESGFPGDLDLSVKYDISLKKSEFEIIFEAKCSENTLLSLTNHSYFTLADELSKLEVKIDGNYYLDVDSEMIPIKKLELCPCMDFRTYKKLTRDIDDKIINRDRLKGYDNYFYFNVRDISLPNISLRNNFYKLDIYSDFEGVQLYSSNYKPDFKLSPKCKNIRDSLAVEPGDNTLELHLLPKDKIYKRHIIYKFERMD